MPISYMAIPKNTETRGELIGMVNESLLSIVTFVVLIFSLNYWNWSLESWKWSPFVLLGLADI